MRRPPPPASTDPAGGVVAPSADRFARRRAPLARGARRGPTSRGRCTVLAAGLLLLSGIPGCGDATGPAAVRGVPDTPPGGGVPFVRVAGTPAEMGRALGAALRAEIRARVQTPVEGAVADAVEVYAEPIRALLPAGAWEELAGIAEGAGVDVAALYRREIAGEVRRWIEPEAPVETGAFASAPGATPCVAVAYDRGARGGAAGVVVERRPTAGGRPTVVLGAPGSLGGLVGVGLGADGAALVVAVVEDGSREPQQRSLRGAPFGIAVRYALERAADLDALVADLPRTLGHRVLGAGADNRRVEALLALAGDDPVTSPPTAWVVRASAAGDAARNAAALDARLGGYPARPGPDDALDLATAGRAAVADGGVRVRATPAGLEIGLGAGPAVLYPFRGPASR